MEINITIKGIEQFTEAVALLASAMAHEKGMVKTRSAAQGIAKPTKEEVAEEIVPEEKKEITEEATAVTIEEVRAAFMAKNSKSNAPKLKKILADHGVEKVTALEEKDFLSVINALGKI